MRWGRRQGEVEMIAKVRHHEGRLKLRERERERKMVYGLEPNAPGLKQV